MTNDLIEKVALIEWAAVLELREDMYALNYSFPSFDEENVAAAKAIIAALDGSHGWKLVPVEPTEEMLTAGCRPYMDKKGGIEIYRDMLAFSPDPLTEPEKNDG